MRIITTLGHIGLLSAFWCSEAEEVGSSRDFGATAPAHVKDELSARGSGATDNGRNTLRDTFLIGPNQ